MERDKLVALVTAGQQGDPDALNELFNAFYNDVYYFALKTVKDEDLACDITQETFIKVIDSLGELREPAAFVTWMKQITYNECCRYFKKKKDILVDEDEEGNTIFDTLAEDRTDFIPGEALDQEDFRKTILAMLDTLSPEQRSAVLLYYYDEIPVKQIAEIQGVSEGTVKSRLNYARKSIKTSVEDYEKKNNIKLHSFGFFPFIVWLLAASEEAMPAGAAAGVAGTVSAATGTAIAVSGGSAAATATASAAAAATATAASTTAAAAGTGAAAAIPFAAKVAAVVIAATVTVGGISAAVSQEDPLPTAMPTVTTVTTFETTVPTTVSATEETAEPTTEPTTEPATEPTTEPATAPTSEPTEPSTAPTEPETEPTEPVTEPSTEPTEAANLVPAGCTYITADGTTIEAGGAMPATVSKGDQFITEDYTYTHSDGWGVVVNDTTKSSYGALLSYINGQPLTSMYQTFADCTGMTVSPKIPDTVTNMHGTFWFCHALKAAPEIPEGVITLNRAFYYCSSLTESPILPSTVRDLTSTFISCLSLTTAPVIPNGVVFMGTAFMYCASLKTAPVIPASVEEFGATFYNCSSLTGQIVIYAEPTWYDECFSGTTQPIVLTGTSTVLAELTATSENGNVTVG